MPAPRTPFVVKGALVTIDPQSSQPNVVTFQYNPSTLRRSIQPMMAGGEENDRSAAVRFTGAPSQTISVEIEIDSTDQRATGDWNDDPTSPASNPGQAALAQLSVLELLVYPSVSQVALNQSQASQGVLEVAPMTAPRTFFVWGAKRVLPVRIESCEITEELFDNNLRPVRATVALSMRVLNYADLDFSNPQYQDFAVYQQNLVAWAGMNPHLPVPEGTPSAL